MLAVTASNSLGTTHAMLLSTTSEILYSLLADQLYTKGVNFCSFVRKSCQACVSNIHPDVFRSFYQTVTHGEFHATELLIYKEIILMVTAQ